MLILTFHNVTDSGETPSGLADYDVQVFVNRRLIAESKVIGHTRSAGWQKLVQSFAETLGNTEASDGSGTKERMRIS